MDLRRIAFRGLLAAPLVVGGGATYALGLPRLVREQLAARVQERLGLPARVAGVSAGLFSFGIDEVAIGPVGKPLLRARQIAVNTSPIALAFRGIRAVRALSVGELQVTLPIEQAVTRRALARIVPAAVTGSSKATDSGAEDAPALEIERFGVEVSDGQGALLRVSGGKVSASARAIRVAVERVLVGDRGSDELDLRSVALQVERDAQGARLKRVSVARAALRFGVPAATPESAKPSTFARTLAAFDLLSSAPAKSTAVPHSGREPALFERLAAGAELTLMSAAVHPLPDAPPILEQLRATATLGRERALALVGSGRASGGGTVSWDLVLHPSRLEADGRFELQSLPLALLAPFLPAVPWHEPEHGRIDASLVVKTETGRAIAFSGEVSLREAALASARIATEPVREVAVELLGRGRLLPLSHRLELAEAKLRLGRATVDVAGALESSPDHYFMDLQARLPPTPCTDAVRSIPQALLGDMGLASFQGKISGQLRVKLDSRKLDEAELQIDPEDRCAFVAVPAMADLRRFHDRFVHSVLEPDGSLFEMETGPGTPAWSYLDDVSPFFVHAVLAHEDAGFFSHRGFSHRHIRDALVRNLKAGRYVVGASTITMQLVKNVFLHREKTLARKIQEVLLTWWIEGVMEKRDILELYLNVIEYGPGIYGIRNGARHYFNRLPSQLSPAEAVFLACILPNPKRYHAHFERGALSPGFKEVIRRLLVRLGERGSYTREAVAYGLAELAKFKFVPEGTIVPSRQLPAGAAPLPYTPAWDGVQLDDQDGTLDGPDFDDEQRRAE